MITFTMSHPTTQTITRRVAASQAQMIIDAMRRDGFTVVILDNPTAYIVK